MGETRAWKLKFKERQKKIEKEKKRKKSLASFPLIPVYILLAANHTMGTFVHLSQAIYML